MQTYILKYTPAYIPHLHTTRQTPPPMLYHLHSTSVKAAPAYMTRGSQSQVPDLGTNSWSARFPGPHPPIHACFVFSNYEHLGQSTLRAVSLMHMLKKATLVLEVSSSPPSPTKANFLHALAHTGCFTIIKMSARFLAPCACLSVFIACG